MEIRKLQEGDFEYVMENLLEKAVKNYPLMNPQHFSYTGIFNGKIMGIGGAIEFWKGVGELWLILTKHVLEHKVVAYRCLKEMAEKIMGERNFVRTQIHVRPDFPQANRMVEKLGFRLEGRLRKYCPDGEDIYIYAKIGK